MPGKSRNPKAAELEELTYLSVLENYVEQLWSNGSKSLLTSNTGKDVEDIFRNMYHVFLKKTDKRRKIAFSQFASRVDNLILGLNNIYENKDFKYIDTFTDSVQRKMRYIISKKPFNMTSNVPTSPMEDSLESSLSDSTEQDKLSKKLLYSFSQHTPKNAGVNPVAGSTSISLPAEHVRSSLQSINSLMNISSVQSKEGGEQIYFDKNGRLVFENCKVTIQRLCAQGHEPMTIQVSSKDNIPINKLEHFNMIIKRLDSLLERVQQKRYYQDI